MKQPSEAVTAVTKRLERTWHEDVSGAGQSWPFAIVITPANQKVGDDFVALSRAVAQWREWAKGVPVSVRYATRMVAGTRQQVPTHLDIASLDHAVALAGADWSRRTALMRQRWEVLRSQFPTAATATLLRAVSWTRYDSADFDLLLAAAHWFAANDATGMTPRQVPLEGFHAKWLDTHRGEVLALCGRETLGLADERPVAVPLTYLDPSHLAAGGRRFDAVVPGDAMTPAYLPEVVIISENKDTAVGFLPVERGVSVEGAGLTGAPRVAQVDWLRRAPRVLYWGDIDAAGFECVNRYRAHGVNVETVLMDAATQERYARFAAATDRNGRPLPRETPKRLEYLTDAEQAVYLSICEGGQAPLRIEQERIPLTVASEVVESMRTTVSSAG